MGEISNGLLLFCLSPEPFDFIGFCHRNIRNESWLCIAFRGNIDLLKGVVNQATEIKRRLQWVH